MFVTRIGENSKYIISGDLAQSDIARHKSGLEDAVKKGVVATRQLAKRQMTWLRNWPGATTINIDNEKEFFSIKEICKQSLQVLK